MKMKYGYLILLMLLCGGLNAQTSDDQFQRPLTEVLDELMEVYNIRIKYDRQAVGNFILPYADWRLVPGDVEGSLKEVLAPFDFTFVTQGEGIYKIKPYQYHLITPEAGAGALEYLKTLYTDKDSWEQRRSILKACIWEALGVDGLPENPDPQVILNGKRKYKGYGIENIALETIPGLYATGSIYTPSGSRRSMPVIITPNGHFGDGRYRSNEQLRCATLAKMGAIVISYDLFAWGESLLQVEGSAHRKSIAHTIQTNNALRLLDYALTIKGADPSRVGITGGSGGGSQTMLVSAIDDRISVSVPVVMTSSFHSGGCPCESGMPIHLCGERTNNAEIAAIFAPKPLLIISDGKDWTFQVPTVEYPFIKRTFEFYNQPDNIENAHFKEEGHDYGFSKRKVMYTFMARHLALDLSAVESKGGQIDESGVVIEEYDRLYVFGNDPGQLPEGAIHSLEELYDVINKEKNE